MPTVQINPDSSVDRVVDEGNDMDFGRDEQVEISEAAWARHGKRTTGSLSGKSVRLLLRVSEEGDAEEVEPDIPDPFESVVQVSGWKSKDLSRACEALGLAKGGSRQDKLDRIDAHFQALEAEGPNEDDPFGVGSVE